jgi:hypothetical protein
MQTIATHHADLAAMWGDMLSHQLPQLPPLSDFWDALPEVFAWLSGAAEAPERAFIQHGAGEIAVRTRVLPRGVPVRSRSTLEIIRFAAANNLCVDLSYDGSVRRIEPYSLRQTLEGNFVLHAIRSDTGEHRSYRVDRMQGASVTSQVFMPRYIVELSSTGPLNISPAAAVPRIAPIRRTARTHSQGPTYVYRLQCLPKNLQSIDDERRLERPQEPARLPLSGTRRRLCPDEVLTVRGVNTPGTTFPIVTDSGPAIRTVTWTGLRH